jgi:hypothetical protein
LDKSSFGAERVSPMQPAYSPFTDSGKIQPGRGEFQR